jgi:hypothetical protein
MKWKGKGNKNARRFWLYKAYSMALYALPLLIYYLAEYAAKGKGRGYSVGFIGYLTIIFLIIGFKSKLTRIIRKNLVLSVSVAVFIVAFIAQFLADAMMIVSALSILGAAASMVFDKVADVYYTRSFKVEGGVAKKIRTEYLPQRKAWSTAFQGEDTENGT